MDTFQLIVANLIHAVIYFLEACLAATSTSTNTSQNKQQSASFDTESDFFKDYNDNSQDDGHPKKEEEEATNNNQKRLWEAYEFCELTPPVTPDEVKRQYKKLSLKYHPDRNGGSDEAKAKFQKLCACIDYIERNLTGVPVDEFLSREDSDDNEDDEEEESESDQEESVDEFYAFIQREQRARRRYRQQQRERERVLQEELKRQRERRRDFAQRVKVEQKACQQRSANSTSQSQCTMNFQQAAAERVSQQTAVNGATSSRRQPAKPFYDTMENNPRKIIIALRLDMPNVVFELLNEDLQHFARQYGQKLGTAQRIKKEYMLRHLDDDGNNLFHYALYYESYQITQMICSTAQREDFWEHILMGPNIHGNTPLFFSQIANDTSIQHLLKSQIKEMEEMKTYTHIGPALQVGINRLIKLTSHIGINPTIDTLLSFTMAQRLFDMQIVSSIGGLFLANVVLSSMENVLLGYPKEIYGVHSFSAFWWFCVLWKILRNVRWEFYFLLIPVVLIALVERKVDFLLSPLMVHAEISNHTTKTLIWMGPVLLPSWVCQKGFVRSYLLLLAMVTHWGYRQLLCYWKS
jgi:hypothetical protein